MFHTLVVEDNATFRQILLNLLSYRFPFMDIDEAESGEDALEKMKAHLPNLVFLDIRLPGENGLELTRKIKRVYPDTVIIITCDHVDKSPMFKLFSLKKRGMHCGRCPENCNVRRFKRGVNRGRSQ